MSPNPVTENSPLKTAERGTQVENGVTMDEKDAPDEDEEYRYPWQRPDDAGILGKGS